MRRASTVWTVVGMSEDDGGMDRVTLRMPTALVTRADAAVERGEYPNRSAAIRDAVRQTFPPVDAADEGDVDAQRSWQAVADGGTAGGDQR